MLACEAAQLISHVPHHWKQRVAQGQGLWLKSLCLSQLMWPTLSPIDDSVGQGMPRALGKILETCKEGPWADLGVLRTQALPSYRHALVIGSHMTH